MFQSIANTFYNSTTDAPVATTGDVLGSLLTALTGGTANGVPLSELPQNQEIVTTTLSGAGLADAYNTLTNASYDNAKPPAFLNYLVFDDNMNLVPENSGVLQFQGAAGVWNNLGTSGTLNVTQGGYLVVYTNSFGTAPVFVDNVSLLHYTGAVQETDHYYPFGLNISSTVNTPGLNNNYKFNGKELQHLEFSDGTSLQWEDYGARMQDPQIGRWNGIDPLSDKYFTQSPYNFGLDNPIRFKDCDGMEPSDFYNKDGNIVKHVDDFSNASYKQTGSGVNLHYEFNGFDTTAFGLYFK